MKTSKTVPRLIMPRLLEALADTPVVLIHGPRQCGKTTLAKMLAEQKGYSYFTFDDDATLALADTDPVGFANDLPDRTILDEVQRLPKLFRVLKTIVDRDRRPGRFILTGSANIMLLPKLSDSLAGRMETIRLHPLAQAEMQGGAADGKPDFIDALFSASFKVETRQRLGRKLAERIVKGGYPALLTRQADRRRASWYKQYIDTIVQRDVRDLAQIRSLDAMPRLLTLVAGQTARMLNIAELAGPFELSRPTIRDYMALLRGVFLADEVPPWYTNRLKRLVKRPKIYMGDTGLAAALLEVDVKSLIQDRAILGQLLETFVYQELQRQASWKEMPISFSHFRGDNDLEVDLVLKSGRAMVAIEVKAAAPLTPTDFRSLRKLKEVVGKDFKGGAILYDGETTAPFGDRLYAVPVRRLWEG